MTVFRPEWKGFSPEIITTATPKSTAIMPPRLHTPRRPSQIPAPQPTHSLRLQQHHLFSSTTPAHAKLRTKTFKPPRVLAHLPITSPPAYPCPAPQWYKQQNLGLYGGQSIRFGNNISEKNEIKTRRTWHPNIKYKWLYSDALGRKIRVKLSTRVLRTIDKVGGLDEYVLGGKSARLRELGMYGWSLRWVVLQKMEEKGRLEGRPALRAELERDRAILEAARVAFEENQAQASEGEGEGEAEEQEQREVDEIEEEEEQGWTEHMEEAPSPVEEKPGLMTRLGRGITAPFRRRVGM